jgi:uncharacterized membrane protein
MLGIIILLTITVVAAVLVYQIYIGKANIAASAPAISIQSATISGSVLTITVQNSGTATLSNYQVEVYNPQGGSMAIAPQTPGGLDPGTLAPGETASGVYVCPYFTPGVQYRVVVTAASNSGTVMASATVMAS